MVELSFAESKPGKVYHLSNPHLFNWTSDFLPALKASGLAFKSVEPFEWVNLLNECHDPAQNPALKLKDYYNQRYGKGRVFKSKQFDTIQTCQVSQTLRSCPEIDAKLVGKFVQHWRKQAFV